MNFFKSSFRKSQTSLIVFATTMVPALLFTFQVHPMVMEAVAAESLAAISIPKFLVWLATFRLSVSVALKTNQNLRAPLDHQIEIFADEFQSNTVEQAITFLNDEIKIAQENEHGVLSDLPEV